jgi:hypothetical protein
MAKVQAIKKDVSAMDRLKEVQTDEPDSKSKVGEYKVGKEITAMASRMWEIKQKKTELDAEFDNLKADLLVGIEPIRMAYLKEGYHESGKIATKPDSDGVTHWVVVTWQDKYEKILSKAEPALRELVGKEYDSLFQLKHSITVKSDIDEADLNEIIDKVTMEKFKKCFNVSLTIKPTSRFTREKYNIFKADKLQAIGTLVRQVFQFRTK